MPIVRIENNAVVEERNLVLDDVPVHKRAAWKPIEGDRPDIDRRYYTLSGPTYQIEGNRVLRVWQTAARDLATVKAEAKFRIDEAAEAARLKYITPGSGQALEYQEVAREAANYVIDPDPQPSEYPLLNASVQAGEAADMAAAVALVQARDAAWTAIGAQIRQLRIAAKRAVDAATTTTVEQVAAAEQVTWP